MEENSSQRAITTEQSPMVNSDSNSDIEILEPSMSVVTNTDDIPDRDESRQYRRQSLLKIKFKNQRLFKKLQEPMVSALEALFKEHHSSMPVTIELDEHGDTMFVVEKEEDQVNPDSSLFIIDSTPTKQNKDKLPIPSYKKAMANVYDGQTPPTKTSVKRRRPNQSCWNCDGEHGLKDCKEPRNYSRIRQKKEEFQKKTDRYHADLEQKYGHFKPGVLSSDLKAALGLGSRDLPLHIYKMRVHGYPPGWLEDAKITHSGLQLFGSNGDAVLHSDEDDGEVDCNRMTYDVRKIIGYPGFNEPPPAEMFDDSKFYSAPPYTEEMSRDNMIQRLEGTLVGGYRRKKLKLSVEHGTDNGMDTTANTEPIDMDEMEYSPEPPQEMPPPAELEDGELSSDAEPDLKTTSDQKAEPLDNSVQIIETPVEIITLDDTVRVEESMDASLAELQNKQKQLMDELGNESTATEDCSFMRDILQAEELYMANAHDESVTESPPTVPVAPTRMKVPPMLESPSLMEPPPPPSSDADASSAECSSLIRPPEPETLDLGEIAMKNIPYIDEPASVGLKSMSLGTPILSSFTPYGSIPNRDAFSKGVSDVIHFENLPNSTGKYEQMKSLLFHVRNKINDHMRETEDGS